MKRVSDKDIDRYLLELQDGNKSALSPLYDLTAKPLYALCYSYFRNREDAEDALSDAFLRVVEEINKFAGNNGFNWMYTVTKNICLNLLKKRNRELAVDFQDEKTVNRLDARENDAITLNDESGIIALAEKVLNGHEFKIVIMHAVGGYRFGEIAEITGRLEVTVRWQYNNALKKLRKAYGEDNI